MIGAALVTKVFAVALSVSILLPEDDFSVEQRLTLGGFICVRPGAPNCASSLSANSARKEIDACRSQIDAFVASTQHYRDCLQGQIGAAVGHANDVIDRFRCITEHRDCKAPKKLPVRH